MEEFEWSSEGLEILQKVKEERKKQREYSKKWHIANRERRKLTPEQERDKHLRQLYGISLTEWHQAFEAQNKCCKICKSPNPNHKHGWHTDHDHITNSFRGILCHRCNFVVGIIENNGDLLPLMFSYLEK